MNVPQCENRILSKNYENFQTGNDENETLHCKHCKGVLQQLSFSHTAIFSRFLREVEKRRNVFQLIQMPLGTNLIHN